MVCIWPGLKPRRQDFRGRAQTLDLYLSGKNDVQLFELDNCYCFVLNSEIDSNFIIYLAGFIDIKTKRSSD